jgi:hypothetical protein
MALKDVHRCHRNKTATSPKTIAKVKAVLTSDARLTFRQIARTVGISKGFARTILKQDL